MRKITPLIFLFFIIFTYFFFSFQHLSKFITADEHYWVYERIPQYWDAWKNGEWKKTLINDKPGVTLALISFPGYLYDGISNDLCTRVEEKILKCDTNQTEKILMAYRVPILFVNASILIILYWLFCKISNKETALWGVFFIAVSSHLVGISQVVNPDALLWSVGAVSIFSYLVFLRHQERKYMVLSGIFLGFAFLSKYTTSILIPFFILINVTHFIFLQKNQVLNETVIAHYKRRIINLTFLFLVATSVVIFFLPAVWMKPEALSYILSGGSKSPLFLFSVAALLVLAFDSYIWKGKIIMFAKSFIQRLRGEDFSRYVLSGLILSSFLTLIVGRIFFSQWNLFQKIPFDLKDFTSDATGVYIQPNFFQAFLLEMNPLVFSLSMTTVILILFQSGRIFFTRGKKRMASFEIQALQALFLFHIFAFIFMDVLATPRYLIIIFPIVAFMVATEVVTIQTFFCKRWGIFSRRKLQLFFAVVIMLTSVANIYFSAPFYLNSMNFFLPKSEIVSDAWGYGGYEAAQYLNSLPNAQDMLVWSDYEGVCEFFKGHCIIKQYKFSEGRHFDYAVVTRRGSVLYNPGHVHWLKKGHLFMKPAYDNQNPDWSFFIGGRRENYVKVVKVGGVPVAP